MEDLISCPITHMIFQEPMVAEDGKTYEKTAILRWFETNNRSPLTNLRISKTLIPNTIIKDIVEKMIVDNPNLKEIQYKRDVSYLSNISKIKTDIRNRNWKNLLNYKEFIFDCIIAEIITKCKDDSVLIYIIDNMGDVNAPCVNYSNSRNDDEEEEDYPGLQYTNYMINYVCRYCSFNVLKHMLSKIDDKILSLADDKQYTPFHYICKYKLYGDIMTFITLMKNTSKPFIFLTNNASIFRVINENNYLGGNNKLNIMIEILNTIYPNKFNQDDSKTILSLVYNFK